MAQTQPQQTVTGAVEAVNDWGVKVNGRWFNFSKFADVPVPEEGQTVRLTIRGDKWIQALRVVTPGALDELEGEVDDDDPGSWGFSGGSGEGVGTAAPRPVRQAAPVRPVVASRPASKASLKAAAIAAAAHFHSARAEASEDEVYGTAFRFLAWIEDEEA